MSEVNPSTAQEKCVALIEEFRERFIKLERCGRIPLDLAKDFLAAVDTRKITFNELLSTLGQADPERLRAYVNRLLNPEKLAAELLRCGMTNTKDTTENTGEPGVSQASKPLPEGYNAFKHELLRRFSAGEMTKLQFLHRVALIVAQKEEGMLEIFRQMTVDGDFQFLWDELGSTLQGHRLHQTLQQIDRRPVLGLSRNSALQNKLT